jgi:hypothetical protein
MAIMVYYTGKDSKKVNGENVSGYPVVDGWPKRAAINF